MEDMKGMEEEGLRTRSFRYEDYNNRRVFLRSYPLHWGEEENKEQETTTTGRVMKGMEEEGLRTRSFRYEDYNNRRVFLRSYPLHWGEEENKEQEMTTATTGRVATKGGDQQKHKKPIKKIILSVIHWGDGKALVFRKFKDKITFYVIACFPVGFKPPTSLISV